MQDLKIISKSFEMDSPQTLSIQILIILCLSYHAYHTYHTMSLIRVRISNIEDLAISLLLNDIDEINLSVLFKNVEGSLLGLFIEENCSAKKELNISAFSLKSVA